MHTRSTVNHHRKLADETRLQVRESVAATQRAATARLLDCQRELALLVARRMGEWILADAAFTTKVRHWLRSFARLDPRTSIAHFFYPGRVAPTGVVVQQAADETQASQCATDGEPLAGRRASFPAAVKLSLETLNTAAAGGSYFSVFRPTSKTALRLMMSRVGVGKGMDIKGKSAKKGRVSGFIPFLQISNDAEVERVPLPGGMDGATVRLYFASEAARDTALAEAVVSLAFPHMVGTRLTPPQAPRTADAAAELAADALPSGRTPPEWTDVTALCKVDDFESVGAWGIEMPLGTCWLLYAVRARTIQVPPQDLEPGYVAGARGKTRLRVPRECLFPSRPPSGRRAARRPSS